MKVGSLCTGYGGLEMGLPEGWVSDADIPYGAKIRILGNGVVPQQSALALGMLGLEELLQEDSWELTTSPAPDARLSGAA